MAINLFKEKACWAFHIIKNNLRIQFPFKGLAKVLCLIA
uniref:Uncharacterized protein n=1 Tax=Anguilla anguilla TaxID=7936 RepID=A0A0E9RXR3_ANGAN